MYTWVGVCSRKAVCGFCRCVMAKGSPAARVGNTSRLYHPHCSLNYIAERKNLLSRTLAVLVKKINAAYDRKISNAKEPEAATDQHG